MCIRDSYKQHTVVIVDIVEAAAVAKVEAVTAALPIQNCAVHGALWMN